MKDFLRRHESKIKGVLSGFDRVMFRGYLPLQDGWSMAQFLNQENIRFRNMKEFLLEQSMRVKAHGQEWAQREGRPFTYLTSQYRMEREARELAEKDKIREGLVCIYSVLEPGRTFSLSFQKGRPFIQSAKRKCLVLYYYFMDRRFGLIHVKIQTWFPMQIQVYINGQEWLANKLQDNDIGFTKLGNVFVSVENLPRAQAFADRFTSLNWTQILEAFARQVNPLLRDVLKDKQHYWVTAQSEYATDVLFKTAAGLKELYPRLINHSMQNFSARGVMGFLGRKLVGNFRGEIISDLTDLTRFRLPGVRIKHRVKENWIKMYDKAGIVLRVETVINNPTEFKVRKSVRRGARRVMEWVPMRKGVAYLFRYRDVALSANARYLDALSIIEDPSTEVAALDKLTRRHAPATSRPVKAFNPLAREDLTLFHALMNAADALRGFNNADMRQRLHGTAHLQGLDTDPKRASAKVSRILHRCRVHGLIAKIPRSRRWRTTRTGQRLMRTAIQLRECNYPRLLAMAA
jgi:hypothetical protein